MLPGPTIIRACPECDQEIKQWTLTSGNTFGATFWTDGRMDAPMLPGQPWLVKCPSCQSLFWLYRARELGTALFQDVETEWRKALPYETPMEADYLQYLSKVKVDIEKEKYLRVRAWWCENDPKREKDSEDKSMSDFSAEQPGNLGRLSELLDESKPDERLMKAELARERGLFEEATQLLQFHCPDDFRHTVETIRSMCVRGDTGVAEIKEHSPD